MKYPSRQLWFVLLLVCMIAAVPACLFSQGGRTGASSSDQAPSAANSSAAASQGIRVAEYDEASYVFSPNDGLEITVFGVPELSQRVRVDAKGDIYFPLLNDVHVGGMNSLEARKEIEGRLRKGNFIKDPHVSVNVTEFASAVLLMGEVNRPSVYPIPGSRRLLDLLTAAGGPNATAGKLVTVINQREGRQENLYLSRDPRLNLNANIELHKGDMITVSRAGAVYIVGEVSQPSSLLMEETAGEFTALKALAMVHGPTRLANLDRAKIVRRTPEGIQTVPVHLKKIMAAQAPDVAMQREDILFVPSSLAKRALLKTAETAYNLASGVALTMAIRQ